MTSMTVRRTHAPESPDDLDGCRYEVTTVDGRVFEVAKEFYAQGPSLFTWVVRDETTHAEFRTKKAALRHIEETMPRA